MSNKNGIRNYRRKKNSDSITVEQEKDSNRGDNDKPLAKLLIVDDDPDIVHVLKLGLLKNGFLVYAFTNPEEALQAFKSDADDFRLMVSDIRMPGLSGIQLARKVKEINPDIKVMLMTSFEIRGNEFSKVFPSIHIAGFIQKPFSIRDLTNKILTLLGETKRRKKE
jgi:DNA-binding NtrC family response regulator